MDCFPRDNRTGGTNHFTALRDGSLPLGVGNSTLVRNIGKQWLAWQLSKQQCRNSAVITCKDAFVLILLFSMHSPELVVAGSFFEGWFEVAAGLLWDSSLNPLPSGLFARPAFSFSSTFVIPTLYTETHRHIHTHTHTVRISAGAGAMIMNVERDVPVLQYHRKKVSQQYVSLTKTAVIFFSSCDKAGPSYQEL